MIARWNVSRWGGRPGTEARAGRCFLAAALAALACGCMPNVRAVVVAINPKVYISDADPNAPRAAMDGPRVGPTIEELEESLKSFDSRAER